MHKAGIERHALQRHELQRHELQRHEVQRHEVQRHEVQRHEVQRHELQRHELQRHEVQRHELQRHELQWHESVGQCPKGHKIVGRFPKRVPMLLSHEEISHLFEQQTGIAECPPCGKRYLLEREGSLLDPVRGYFVQVVKVSRLPDWATLEGQVEDAFQAACVRHQMDPAAPYVKRLVFGLDGLRHKLGLWEAGLDDALVEVVRLQAFQMQSARGGQASRTPPALLAVDLEQARLTLHWPQEADSKGRVLHLPFQQYEMLVARRAALEKQLPGLFVRPFVDVRRFLTRTS